MFATSKTSTHTATRWVGVRSRLRMPFLYRFTRHGTAGAFDVPFLALALVTLVAFDGVFEAVIGLGLREAMLKCDWGHFLKSVCILLS